MRLWAAADSAHVVRAAWVAAAEGHRTMRAAVLWIPSESDTGRFVPLSPAVRELLVQSGVPIETRRVVGDDTVVFHVASWRRDSSVQVVELRSSWSTILRGGARACRTGSGNVERFRVRESGNTWTAYRVGPVIHGDRECVPIPPREPTRR